MTDPLKNLNQQIDNMVMEKYVGTNYTDSYISFLDILGMKELVKRSYIDLRTIFNAVESGRELYCQIKVPGGSSFIDKDHLKITIMSDALVLSIDSDIDDAFSKLIGFSSYLINRLLKVLEIPIFLRGGISRGLIFHDDDIVFGPGLVDAYSLENDIAKSMRCIISPNLNDDVTVQKYLSSKGCALITDPVDKLFFIDYVRPEIRDHLNRIATEVIESDVKDKIKDKYKWLSHYIDWSK